MIETVSTLTMAASVPSASASASSSPAEARRWRENPLLLLDDHEGWKLFRAYLRTKKMHPLIDFHYFCMGLHQAASDDVTASDLSKQIASASVFFSPDHNGFLRWLDADLTDRFRLQLLSGETLTDPKVFDEAHRAVKKLLKKEAKDGFFASEEYNKYKTKSKPAKSKGEQARQVGARSNDADEGIDVSASRFASARPTASTASTSSSNPMALKSPYASASAMKFRDSSRYASDESCYYSMTGSSVLTDSSSSAFSRLPRRMEPSSSSSVYTDPSSSSAFSHGQKAGARRLPNPPPSSNGFHTVQDSLEHYNRMEQVRAKLHKEFYIRNSAIQEDIVPDSVSSPSPCRPLSAEPRASESGFVGKVSKVTRKVKELIGGQTSRGKSPEPASFREWSDDEDNLDDDGEETAESILDSHYHSVFHDSPSPPRERRANNNNNHHFQEQYFARSTETLPPPKRSIYSSSHVAQYNAPSHMPEPSASYTQAYSTQPRSSSLATLSKVQQWVEVNDLVPVPAASMYNLSSSSASASVSATPTLSRAATAITTSKAMSTATLSRPTSTAAIIFSLPHLNSKYKVACREPSVSRADLARMCPIKADLRYFVMTVEDGDKMYEEVDEDASLGLVAGQNLQIECRQQT